MSNIEQFPTASSMLTEYEALLAAAPNALDAMPCAVYICDSDGWLVRYNAEAVQLWGRAPQLGVAKERFCGAYRLFSLDGTPLPYSQSPVAKAVLDGIPASNIEVVMERPDGSRIVVMANVRPLKDRQGNVQGAINCLQDITARMSMGGEVELKNADLEDFFENGAIGLHIVSGEGIILRANKAELDMLGYTADEYIGRHIAEFHADAPVIGEILHRLSCKEKIDRFPARLRAKDGSIKHVLITSNSRFADRKFLNTRCFTMDITSLREAEIARRESEERLAATYEAATVAIAETSENGRMLRVNDALCRILDRPREELLCMSFSEYTHEDDLEEDVARYAKQVSGQIDSYSIRKRAVKPDGSIAYLDVYSSSVRDADGRFRYGVRVIQDVTEAKQMEDRLRESERHMRELLEALPAAVYTTDPNGNITFYNKAAVELAGRTPQAGDRWCVARRLYWPDGTPMLDEESPVAVALKEDRMVRGLEAMAERPDGTRVPFIPYPTPLHDAKGKLIGAINMLIDITERKEADNRQKTLIDELNHRVKNTLATVQSLAYQTIRHASGLDEFVCAFEARLLSLGRAHDLLTRRHWQDAPLDTLVREITAPLAGAAEGRVRIDGPAVQVHPRIALNLTMSINELITNAAKYGALTADEGSLSIHWSLSEEENGKMLSLFWREQGGPRVTPPVRRGFGTRLIERCVERDLDGELDLAFEPTGLQCRITIPVAERRPNE